MQPEEFIATLERFLRPPNSSQPTTGQRNAVCLIRLDQLGQINNSIGYESAGLLLEEFNHRVRSFTRVQDLAIPLERHKVGVLLRGISNEEHITLAKVVQRSHRSARRSDSSSRKRRFRIDA